MTDEELLELVKKIIIGRPDARDPLFALLKTLSGGGGGSVAWEDITDVPVALTAAQAAGTASIRALGTSATTAAAGNHTHTGAQVTLTGYAIGTAVAVAATDTANAAIGKLEARIVALEGA